MNKVILIGNLSKDVELTTTPNGISVAKFSLAVNRNYTNSNGERECDFFNIVAWRDLAERCNQYLSKGKKAAICGALQTRSYENADGIRVYITEIIADNVEFLSPKESVKQPPQIKDLETVQEELPF